MDMIMKIAVDYFLIDACILGVGLLGAALVYERVKSLYFDFAIDAKGFMDKVMKLVHEDKIEEAITLCSANDKKPLAHVAKRILERSDRDEAALNESLDIAASEMAPKLSKNLGIISMTSNVATLIGLLGTVVGLIMSFKAVSFADPSQKQTLLADGISLAMHATALGLLVAIPLMVVYSFLHARQGKLFSEIDEHSGKLIEALKARDFGGSAMYGAFPANVKTTKTKAPERVA